MTEKNDFSHTDSDGKAKMVDVSEKKDQVRIAVAAGLIKLSKKTIDLIKKNQIKKGDVLTVAEIAGIQSAKSTSNLIPLCHPLFLTNVSVKASITDDGVKVESEVKCIGKTGVEMEALTAVSVALLTIYDMCKAIDKKMVIKDVHLTNKTKEDINELWKN